MRRGRPDDRARSRAAAAVVLAAAMFGACGGGEPEDAAASRPVAITQNDLDRWATRCWVHEPTNGGPRYHLRLWQAIIETWPGARLIGMPVIESPTWPATIETSFTTPDGVQHYLQAHTWPPVSGMDCPIEILSDSHAIMNARATP